MIEHKFFSLSKYKDLSEATRELDKMMMYEGFVVLCSVGKKNNILLLRRILEDQQLQQPIAQPAAEPTTNKRNTKKKVMFPNAVR